MTGFTIRRRILMGTIVVDGAVTASPSAPEQMPASAPQPVNESASCCSQTKQATCCEPSNPRCRPATLWCELIVLGNLLAQRASKEPFRTVRTPENS